MPEIKKLGHTSVAARNAAFDAVHAEIIRQLNQWEPPHIPFMDVRAEILKNLESPKGRQLVLATIDVALEAAEEVEEREEAAAAAVKA